MICSNDFWFFLTKLRDFLRVLGERQIFTKTFQRSNSLAKVNREKSKSNKSDEEEGSKWKEIEMKKKEDERKMGGGLEDKRKKIEIKLLCFVSFLSYFVQVGMIDLSISGFRCTLIEDVYYNRYDMSYECWDIKHIIWFVAIYLPSLLFWTVGINKALLKLEIMRKSRLRSKEGKEKDKGKSHEDGKEENGKQIEESIKKGRKSQGLKEDGGIEVERKEEAEKKNEGKNEEGCQTAGGRIEGQNKMLFLIKTSEAERQVSGITRKSNEQRRRSSGNRREEEERKRKEENGTQLICFIGVKRSMRKYDVWLSILRYLGILFLSVGLEEDMEGVYFMQFCVFACSFLVYFQFKPYERKLLNKLNLLMMFVVLTNFYLLAIVKIYDDELISQLFHAFYILEHVFLGGLGLYEMFRRRIGEVREKTRSGSVGMKNYRNVVITNVIYV